MIIAAVLVGILSVVNGQGTSSDMRRVCYHTNWSQYRPTGGTFFPNNIDANLCTHGIYAFANLENNVIVPREYNDDGPGGLYEMFTNLVQINSNYKALLGLIGNPSSMETSMLSTDANRATFVNDVVTFLRERNFQGINIDFYAPGALYKARFNLLFQELRTAFANEAANSGNAEMVISVTLSGVKSEIDASFDVPGISASVDFINLLTYDMWGSWDGVTGHHSPAHARTGQAGVAMYRNWEWISNYFFQLGAPKSKLHPGFGLFARSFTLSSSNTGYDAPVSGAGQSGSYTLTGGQFSYYEICSEFMPAPATRVWNDEHKVPYAYVGNQWAAYDDTYSVEYKARWATENGYGGVMVFAYDMDDFGNMCNAGNYPLINTIIANLGKCIDGSSCGGTTTAGLTTSTTSSATTTMTTTTTVSTTAGSGDGCDSNFCSSRADGLYAHPTLDCGYYCECYGIQAWSRSCATGTCFDTSTETCNA